MTRQGKVLQCEISLYLQCLAIARQSTCASDYSKPAQRIVFIKTGKGGC